jgi:hypothetical protein
LRDALTEPLTKPASQGALRGKPEQFGDSRQRAGLVLKQLFAVGWRPIGLMTAETVWIAALVFISARYLI